MCDLCKSPHFEKYSLTQEVLSAARNLFNCSTPMQQALDRLNSKKLPKLKNIELEIIRWVAGSFFSGPKNTDLFYSIFVAPERSSHPRWSCWQLHKNSIMMTSKIFTPRKLFSPNKSPSGVQSNPNCSPAPSIYSRRKWGSWIDLENRLLSIGHRSQCGISREKSRPFSFKILQYVAANLDRTSSVLSINCIMSMTSFWRLETPMSVTRKVLKTWDPEFDLEKCPDIEIATARWEIFTPMQRALDRFKSKKLEEKEKQQQNQEQRENLDETQGNIKN